MLICSFHDPLFFCKRRSRRTTRTQHNQEHSNRDRRSAIDNDEYSDFATQMPNRLSAAGEYPTKSLLSSESHKVSPRHVASFVFAVVISTHGSFFIRPSDSFRQSKGTGDEYDDTDFFLDIFICLFCYLQILELRFYIYWVSL